MRGIAVLAKARYNTGALIVPNYIPEPLEVPGNVTEERYSIRLAFIRRVTVYHVSSLLLVGALAYLPWPAVGLTVSGLCLAVFLVLLDLWRIRLRGRPSEAKTSLWLLTPLLLTVAWFGAQLRLSGIPAWGLVVGPVVALGYTFLCGRDYSFMGCWVLSLIASSVAVAATADAANLSSSSAALALALTATYLTYFVYDLASLMARRRRGEELAAVVDLYRDVFNFFGYTIRVIRHWQKHRIWAAPVEGVIRLRR